jgi:hypothetical protein
MTSDWEIPAPRADQAMSVAAVMVAALIGTFGKPEDSSEELVKLHLALLATFIHQLLAPAKYKPEVIGILEAIIIELKEPANDHLAT